MNLIICLIVIPFIAGCVCLFIPKKSGLSGFFALMVSIVCLVLSFKIYKSPAINLELFLIDGLNRFITPAIVIFGFLIILYSLDFLKLGNCLTVNFSNYYCYILWTISAALGAVLSNNLILLLVFWSFLGVTLYLLIQISSDVLKFNGPSEQTNSRVIEQASSAAKKTFTIIGSSDCVMLLGIIIIWVLTGTFRIDKINIQLNQSGWLGTVAFLCLAIAAFAKAGAVPFHTWIPDMATIAPVPVTAFLPASLDKLLGIYLLARLCINLFTLNSQLSIILMLIGSLTIVAPVFMALIQRDFKKLLSYHAVSQVGYMVLGIGTGNPVGIAGGIFHMLNNAIYKTCLFLCCGSVEYKAGTSNLYRLGGLSKFIPITFVSCLIASLSISGVPPFNGFVSKGMVCKGIIQLAGSPINQLTDLTVNRILCFVFLISAMLGTVLTLASFMKLIYLSFLGKPVSQQTDKSITEVPWKMLLPQIILALTCVLFGIFSLQLPLKYFIFPSISVTPSTVIADLKPGLTTFLAILMLIMGVLIFTISEKEFRIGREISPEIDFYQPVRNMCFLKQMYFLAEKKMFDIYEQGKNIALSLASVFSVIHSGYLHRYLIWCFVAVVILLSFAG